MVLWPGGSGVRESSLEAGLLLLAGIVKGTWTSEGKAAKRPRLWLQWISTSFPVPLHIKKSVLHLLGKMNRSILKLHLWSSLYYSEWQNWAVLGWKGLLKASSAPCSCKHCADPELGERGSPCSKGPRAPGMHLGVEGGWGVVIWPPDKRSQGRGWVALLEAFSPLGGCWILQQSYWRILSGELEIWLPAAFHHLFTIKLLLTNKGLIKQGFQTSLMPRIAWEAYLKLNPTPAHAIQIPRPLLEILIRWGLDTAWTFLFV